MLDYWKPTTATVMQESLPSALVFLKFLICKGENLRARISKIREKWYS